MKRHSLYFALGRIVKVHGIRGEIQVYPYSEKLSLFDYRDIFIQDLLGNKVPKKVVKVRPKGSKGIILSLDGIDDRAKAEALVGMEILVERAHLPPLAPGEYYWDEIEGIAVESVTGEKLGILSDVFSTHAHDVYVVRGDRGEILIPAVRQMVKKIEPDRGIMVVDLPSGLIEANAL
jgi:16S rRNA processing protein RimM